MDRYLYIFYKIEFPLIFLSMTPIVVYHISLGIAPGYEDFSALSRLLFPRMECDVKVIQEFLIFNPDSYVLAYFSGFFVCTVFVIVHIINFIVVGNDLFRWFRFEKVKHIPAAWMLILCSFSTVVIFFGLSSQRSYSAIGCSWFYNVIDKYNFEYKFLGTLLFIGLAQGAIYVMLVQTILNFVRTFGSPKS